jgi:adenylate kinase family enzyme
MGSSGSGKSIFARRLADMTGVPFVSLDALFWKPGWVESGKAEFRERLTEVALRPRWIMDGNFPSHLVELRRDACDTLIWFDLPRATCMLGIMKRIAGSWTYRRQQRPKLLAYFAGLRADQSLVCFTDRAQASDYLQQVELTQNRASMH